MRDAGGAHGPTIPLHHIVRPHLGDIRGGLLALARAAASVIDGYAAHVLGARHEIGPESAAFLEQCPRDRLDGRGTVHLELRNAPGTLVPAREQQPRIVAHVIVVQVAAEEMRYARGRDAELEQTMVRAETMVED